MNFLVKFQVPIKKYNIIHCIKYYVRDLPCDVINVTVPQSNDTRYIR